MGQPSINVDQYVGSPMLGRNPRETFSPPVLKKQNTIGESKIVNNTKSPRKEEDDPNFFR
jgi:hypothetical protein